MKTRLAEDYIASVVHDNVPPTHPFMKGAEQPEPKGEAAPGTESPQSLTSGSQFSIMRCKQDSCDFGSYLATEGLWESVAASRRCAPVYFHCEWA